MNHDDIAHITRTVYEFAYGIDTRDWTLYRGVFTDGPIEFDYESYHGRPATLLDPDEWIGNVRRLFEGLDATQHSMSNPIVDIESDGIHARCRVYMQAAHFLSSDDLQERTGDPNPEFAIGGFYDDRLTKIGGTRNGGWRIEAVKLTVWWRRGNAGIMQLATERTAP